MAVRPFVFASSCFDATVYGEGFVSGLLDGGCRQGEALSCLFVACSVEGRDSRLGKVGRSVEVHAHGIGKGVLHAGEALGLVSVRGSELEFDDSCLHGQIMT